MATEIGWLSGPAGADASTRKQQYMGEIGEKKELPVWHPDHESSPPPGSTEESLLVFEGGRPVRVAGPTHYVHLADGRVIGGYGGGTHHSDTDENGSERIVRIVPRPAPASTWQDSIDRRDLTGSPGLRPPRLTAAEARGSLGPCLGTGPSPSPRNVP